MGTTLEMQQKKTKGRLEELRALSQKAENGNPEARRGLKRAVRESSPEIVVKASDFARRGQRILAEGYGQLASRSSPVKGVMRKLPYLLLPPVPLTCVWLNPKPRPRSRSPWCCISGRGPSYRGAPARRRMATRARHGLPIIIDTDERVDVVEEVPTLVSESASTTLPSGF